MFILKNIFMISVVIVGIAHADSQSLYLEGQQGIGNIDLSSFATQDLVESKETAASLGYQGIDVLGDINEANIEGKARHHKRRSFEGEVSYEEFLVDSNVRAESQKVGEKDAIASLIQEGKKISDDPQKHFQVGPVQKITRPKTKTVQKTCQVSADFELKTVISLKYREPERIEKETVLTIYYPEYVKKVGRINDEMGDLSTDTQNYQVDIERFRKHACPHFKPVDAITKKTYKINCERIKNFSMVSVPDRTYVGVTDKYGDSFKAVRLIKISYKHDTYQGGETLKDTHWSFKTPNMSDHITKYNCALKNRRCLDNSPRNIHELEVHQPCWEEELTYDCGKNINTCKEIEGKGCQPKSKKCLEEINGVCALFEKTYDCLEKATQVQNTSDAGDLPFCWSGACHSLETDEDQEFGEVAAKLGMLQDMQNQLEKDKESIVGIFKGAQISCNRHMLNFKDCCGSCKGWGVSLGLNTCSAEEKTLAKRRQEGQCHYVGKFCAEKVPLTGICLREKHAFCCFGSKLSRVFQEQGRKYLGLGWGTPKCPDCRAFTIPEIETIKWDTLDFREVFSDVTAHIKPASGRHTFQNKIPNLQEKAQIGTKGRGYDLTA